MAKTGRLVGGPVDGGQADASNGHPPVESDWPDVDVRLGYDAPPLLQPGDYTARLLGIKKRFSYGSQPRLFFDFAVIEGDHAGAVVQFICTLPGQPKITQRFGRVAPSSRFFRAWVVANGGHRPSRHDRMSLDVFRHRLFRIRVRTVEKDRTGQPLPLPNQYSVVDMLVERVA